MRLDQDWTRERVLSRQAWGDREYSKDFAGLDSFGKLQRLVDRRRMRILILSLKQRFEVLCDLPATMLRPKKRAVIVPGEPQWEYDQEVYKWALGVIGSILSDWEPRYLWYTDATLEAYEMRWGRPPHDKDRPVWMRGLRLELEPDLLPESTIAELLPGGRLDRMIDDYPDPVQQRGLEKHTKQAEAKREVIDVT
jgi:hypothetical protein